MIPFVAVVSLRNQDRRTFRFWIPLFPVWILLLPLAVALSPIIFAARLAWEVNPFRAFQFMWQVLAALGETEFEMEHRSAGLSFHISEGRRANMPVLVKAARNGAPDGVPPANYIGPSPQNTRLRMTKGGCYE